ncbi:MAG: hypothetical protein IJN17_04965 [Clostridia bacterium]|nr:hypothetical protein [Clostridia bacterium]
MPTIITRAEKKRTGEGKKQSRNAVLSPKCCRDHPERFTVYKAQDIQQLEEIDEYNRESVYE